MGRQEAITMQIGIDSFAAAYDESSRAVSPSERLRNLVEQIEHADQVGLDVLGSASTTVRSTWMRRRRSFSAPPLHAPVAFV